MKTQIKNTALINNQAKIDSKVTLDSNLDKIKNIKFTSNTPEEINKVDFKLSFLQLLGTIK